MRDRLIKLLQSVPTDYEGHRGVGTIADYLLANGVIAPPCKVGDTVYSIDNGISSQFFVGEVYEILVRKNIIVFRYTRKGYYSGGSIKEDFGKTVFLTREEAEAKLKGEVK